ncbi:MAG TPA: hypothetical protein VMV18_05525 [bacterium]|nr:hypothetical protein [bacterium]
MRVRAAVLLCVAVAVALAVFVLPWHVPPLAVSAGESYLFGFTNGAAIAALGLILLALALLAWRRPDLVVPLSMRRAGEGLFVEKNELPAWTLAVAVALTALPPLWLWSRLDSSCFGEATQLLHQMELALAGRAPYRAFVFPYGPFFLYGPLLLFSVGGGAIPLDVAYLLSLLGEIAVGAWLLFLVARRLALPRNEAAVLYLLVAAAGLNFTLGENYTFFRFAAPLAAIVIVDARAAVSRRSSIAVAAACALLALGISPEIGLLTVIALAALFLARAWQGDRALAAGAAAVVAVPLAALPLVPGYLFAVGAFGGGGYNFPVFPTAHVVLYLVAVLAAVLALGTRLGGDARERGLAASFLAVVALGSAGALGRCDAGHLFWNGIGAFLVTATVALRASRIAGRAWLAVFGVVFTAGMQVVHLGEYGTRIREGIARRDALDARGLSPFENARRWQPLAPNGSPFLWARMPVPSGELQRLEKYPRVGTPIEFSEDVDRFLKLTGRFVPERVPPPVMGILNEQQLAWKLDDLKTMDVVLLPNRSLALLAPDDAADAAARSAFLSGLLLYPVHLSFRRSFFPERVVVRTIDAEFDPVDRVWDYVVMVRKGSAAAPPPEPAPPTTPSTAGSGTPTGG